MKRLQLSMRHLRRIIPPFVIIGAITNVANLTIRMNEYVNPPAEQPAAPVVCLIKPETK